MLNPARSASPMNASSSGAIRANGGASATSASTIPCTREDSGGIDTPGFTRRVIVSRRPSGCSLTSESSTMRSTAGFRPVVSRSMKTRGRVRTRCIATSRVRGRDACLLWTTESVRGRDKQQLRRREAL